MIDVLADLTRHRLQDSRKQLGLGVIDSLFPSIYHLLCILLHSILTFSLTSTNMAEVRQRAKAADPSVAPSEPPSSKPAKKSSGFGVTDVLRILGGILLLNAALSYFVTSSSLTWGWRPWYSKPGVVASWLVCPSHSPHYPSREPTTNEKPQTERTRLPQRLGTPRLQRPRPKQASLRSSERHHLRRQRRPPRLRPRRQL